MQATRQRILDYLEQRGSATATQLALAFGMTAANVRRHLGILAREDLVQIQGTQAPGGRGRPDVLYILKPLSDLEPLTRALLRSQGGRRAKALATELIGNQTPPSGPATKRLVNAVQELTPLGYKPHWEARPQGPQIVLGRCPYASIIADHPELCQMDAHMLEHLLGVEVEQTAKLARSPQGTPQCVFRIINP